MERRADTFGHIVSWLPGYLVKKTEGRIQYSELFYIMRLYSSDS